ncbi:MAG: hypothetical protein M3O61_14720 [Gemmatimonadota bacterium]|nr:hypothetical protein [Gemmatimonadota bacterium]
MNEEFRPAAASALDEPEVPAGYEAPRIESSMSADDIERDVLYAGQPVTPA